MSRETRTTLLQSVLPRGGPALRQRFTRVGAVSPSWVTVGLAALAAAGLIASPVHAADITLEDLAEQMRSMQTEIAELRTIVHRQSDTIAAQSAELEERDLMSVSVDARPSALGLSSTTVGGYVDLEFMNYDQADSDFDQHRFILNVSSQLHDRISFYSEIEMEHGVDTGAGGGAVEIEQAYVDFELYPWLVFRTGALLVPFSRYNLLHDSDLNDLTSRPLYARQIVPTTWTEAGAGFTGDVLLPRDMDLNYELYVINGLDDGIGATGTRSARPALRRDNNNDKALVGRVALTPTPWSTIGTYGYAGRWTSSHAGVGDPSQGLGSERAHGYGVDLFLHRGPWEFIGEYGMFDFQDADRLGPDANGLVLDGGMHGGYAQLAYHFWPAILNQSPLGQPYDDPTFTLVGRYDTAEIELLGADDNSQDRWTIGMNYRPIEEMVFKLEWQWNDHDGPGPDLENAGEQGVMASAAWAF